MIQTYTRLNVADNSGAKRIRLINIPGSSRRKYAKLGDVIVCTVREGRAPTRQCERDRWSRQWWYVRPRECCAPTVPTSSLTTTRR